MRKAVLIATCITGLVVAGSASARVMADGFGGNFGGGLGVVSMKGQAAAPLPNNPADPRGNVGNVWLLYSAAADQPTAGTSFTGAFGFWTGSYADQDGYPVSNLHLGASPDGTDFLCTAAVATGDGALLYPARAGYLATKSSSADPDLYSWSWAIPDGTAGDLFVVSCSPLHALRFLAQNKGDPSPYYHGGAEVVCSALPVAANKDEGCLQGQPFVHVWRIS